MEGYVVVAVVLAVAVMLIPVAFVGYLNIGGVMAAVRKAKAVKAAIKVH